MQPLGQRTEWDKAVRRKWPHRGSNLEPSGQCFSFRFSQQGNASLLPISLQGYHIALQGYLGEKINTVVEGKFE